MQNANKRLSWAKSDIEQRFGFRGGHYTAVNTPVCVVFAAVMTVSFYLTLFIAPNGWFVDMFTKRGMTPYGMVFLANWTFCILLLKTSKIRLQTKALSIAIVPREHDFVLSPNTVDQVLRNVNDAVEQPKSFFLFNRIVGTLSNLKNIGMVSEVGDIFRAYNDHDIETVETSYSFVNGFLWAIPVLGFIGTAEGLTKAIGSFGTVLASGADVSALTMSLQDVTGGLATAFETTLIALVLALFLQLLAMAIRKSEEELLLACVEYCTTNIVSRLRTEKLNL
jgi:hypothetical protein